MMNEQFIIFTERLQLTEMLHTDRHEVLQIYFNTHPVAALLNEKGGDISETVQDAARTEIHKDMLNYVIMDMTSIFIGRVCMQHLSDNCH